MAALFELIKGVYDDSRQMTIVILAVSAFASFYMM